MSERSRQPAVLLILLILVGIVGLAASACGGDDVTTTTTRMLDPTTPAAGGTGGATTSLIGTQLRTTPDTPDEYVEAVKEGRPVVVLFHMLGGVDDQKVHDSLYQLQANFSEYAFLFYDCSQPDAYGDLSTLLKINYPPAVVLIDATGTIRTVWNGYVDEGTLNQHLVNLGV